MNPLVDDDRVQKSSLLLVGLEPFNVSYGPAAAANILAVIGHYQLFNGPRPRDR
jgi:hypothetical protein